MELKNRKEVVDMDDVGKVIGWIAVGIVAVTLLIGMLLYCSDDSGFCRVCGRQGTNVVGYCNTCWEEWGGT